MLRRWVCPGLLLVTLVLASGSVLRAEEEQPAGGDAQALLDKAIDVKLNAENLADLNQVVKLCTDALAGGLDDGNKKFCNDLLASTLTQRGELACMELFERPVTPNRARKLVQSAVSDLAATIKIDPAQPAAQYLLGRLYAHLGESEKALSALNEAVKLSGDDPAAKAKALLIRANLHAEEPARLADFDEAVKLTPHDPNVLRFRGMYYLGTEKLEPAVADLKAAIELDDKDADTYEALGIALAMSEELEEALTQFNKAIEIQPNSPVAFSHRARIRAMQGDFEAAMKDVEQSLKLQPGGIQSRQLRASLLTTAGKFDEALEDLNLLRRAMPDNVEVLGQVALLYQAAKKPNKAVFTYNQLLELDPESAAGFRGRADAYLSLGKQSQAMTDYEAALKIKPEDSGVLNNLAWLLATSTEDNLRDGKRAIELAKQACELTEYKQAHILSTLAAGYAETGDFDTAIEWSTKAVDLGNAEVKEQLKQELTSYQAKKPWREAAPVEAPPQRTAAGEKPAPDSDDTARNKRGG